MIDYKNAFRIINKAMKIYRGGSIPLRVTQYVTYRCNLSCGFCGRFSIKTEELDTPQSIRCMKDFKSLGTEFWGFNGGEPLIREDIGELISGCRKIGMKASLMTNGILIAERVNEIKDLDLILVSIDGPEEIHDKIRGKGCFSKALRGMDILKKNNKKFLIVTVINKENIAYLGEVLEIAEYYNCLCEFQPVYIHHSDTTNRAGKYMTDGISSAAEYLIKQKKAGGQVASSFAYLGKIRRYPRIEKQRCWASRLFCVITPNGRVYPCCAILSQDNLYNSGLEIGWKNAYRALPRMNDCKGCFLFCYSEYNIIFNNPLFSSLRIARNLLSKKWICK